jgi:hypothetical protein
MKEEAEWQLYIDGATISQTTNGIRIATCIHDPDRTICKSCKEIVDGTGLLKTNSNKIIENIMGKIIHD